MTIDATRDQSHGLAHRAAPFQLFTLLHDFWNSLSRHAEMRRVERASQTMDANVLRDIGIDRNALLSALYAPPRERNEANDVS